MSEQRSTEQLVRSLESTAEALRGPEMEQIRGLMMDAAQALSHAEEFDVLEQMVADGELCAVDGHPCEFETRREQYGADADGNRYIWVEYTACRKCGEPPR